MDNGMHVVISDEEVKKKKEKGNDEYAIEERVAMCKPDGKWSCEKYVNNLGVKDS